MVTTKPCRHTTCSLLEGQKKIKTREKDINTPKSMKGAEPRDLVQHNYRRNGRQNASNSSFLEAKYAKFRFSVVRYLNSKTTDKETCKENVNNSCRGKAGKGNHKRRDEKVKPLLAKSPEKLLSRTGIVQLGNLKAGHLNNPT